MCQTRKEHYYINLCTIRYDVDKKCSIEVHQDFYRYQTAGASINQSGRRYTCGQMYKIA